MINNVTTVISNDGKFIKITMSTLQNANLSVVMERNLIEICKINDFISKLRNYSYPKEFIKFSNAKTFSHITFGKHCGNILITYEKMNCKSFFECDIDVVHDMLAQFWKNSENCNMANKRVSNTLVNKYVSDTLAKVLTSKKRKLVYDEHDYAHGEHPNKM